MPTAIYFAALTPDPAFSEWLWAAKARGRALAGDQLYLQDPPHLTVYLATFPAETDWTALDDALETIPRCTLTTTGWHVFAGDVLTGRQTLVCDLRAEDATALRAVQLRTAELLAPRRDIAATRARYDDAWPRLSTVERANVERWGFPFVGEIWHPHFTVAAIDAAVWPAVWTALASEPPAGEIVCDTLTLYRLDDCKPVMVREIPLQRRLP